MSLKIRSMITPREIRAARSFFGWSRQDLADLSGLSLNSITRLESGAVDSRTATVETVTKLFEERGIAFLSRSEGGEGIRFRTKLEREKGL